MKSSNPALRAKGAACFLGIGQSTFWKWVAEGRLPKGTRLSARCTIWRQETLEAFLRQAEGAESAQ
jgi:predicted DNA-binding transcriptional regulator AlpA